MHINNLNKETTENRDWEKDLWGTPIDGDYGFDSACEHFNFTPTLDVCASVDNQKCNKCLTKDIDALCSEWDEPFFMNPPYSQNKYGAWMDYAIKQHNKHKVSFLTLVFSKTDTAWWHRCVGSTIEEMQEKGVIPWFVSGRLKFLTPSGEESENSAPYSNVWLYYP